MGEAAQAPSRLFLRYAGFIIVGIIVGAAGIYSIGPIREVPSPTVTLTETVTQTATATQTATTTSPPPPRALADLNLNLSDLRKKATIVRIQTRNSADEFNLWGYPPGMRARFDAEFLREVGFKRSHGIEVSTEESEICSIVLEFEDYSGARTSYYQLLDYLGNRSKYTCSPYVSIPRWQNVADMLDHFTVPANEYGDATEIPNLGDRASWLYDPTHDFFYVVGFSRNILFMVGETGSLGSAIEYAWILASKIQ